MSRNTRRSLMVAACLVGLGAIANSLATAQPPKDAKHDAPAGMSADEMKAMMDAATPGKMHEWIGKHVGTWHGENQMWMAPGAPPMKSNCTNTISVIMGGRYTKADVAGEMPGMGPFMGLGITGYDNVSKKFVGSWIDNMATGIMQGTGELSKDGKTLTWTYTCNCPLTKKSQTMRQVENFPDDNTMILEMFSTDPKSGKEYKCMRIDFSRRAAAARK